MKFFKLKRVVESRKNILIATIFLIFCFETIYLSIQNRNLKSYIREYKFLYENRNINIEKMEYFPDIFLIGMNGEHIKLFNRNIEREFVIFIFSIDCWSCIQMIEKMNKIYEKYKSKYEIIGISTASISKTKRFINDIIIKFPVFCLKEKDKQRIEFPSLPVTLITLSDGRIIQSIIGEFNESFMHSLK